MTNERFNQMKDEALAHYQRTVVDVEESAKRLAHYQAVSLQARTQELMNEIGLDALHVCAAGEHSVALVDFRPAPIVDSVAFQDSWGEGR